MSLGLTQSERYSKRMRSSPGAEWKATLPLTLENRVGRANDQSACRWTHHMTPRRAKVWRVRRGSTLYSYFRKNMAPLTFRLVEAADLVIRNRSQRLYQDQTLSQNMKQEELRVELVTTMCYRAHQHPQQITAITADTIINSTLVITEYNQPGSGCLTGGRNIIMLNSLALPVDQRHQMMRNLQDFSAFKHKKHRDTIAPKTILKST